MGTAADRARLGDRAFLHVPEWVSHSAYGPGFGVDDLQAGRGPRDVMPRFMRIEKVSTPAALAGVSRFHGPPAECRCSCSPLLPNRLAAMVQALGALRSFAELLETNMDLYLGTRGANDHMLSIAQAARAALDWEVLAKVKPRREHYFAFFELAALLEPMLRHAAWPSPHEFPHVRPSWPAKRGTNGYFEQFRLLARKIRGIAKDRSRSESLGWWRVRHWVITPMMRSWLEASVGQWGLLRFASAGVRSHVCGIISGFGVRGVFARTSFRVSPGSLASVGYGARLLGARSRKKEYSFLGGVGSAASLAAPARLMGRVVLVVDAKRDLNLTAVDGSLAALREFGAADEAGEHCYHAVRICLCAALLHGKENFCERAGSIIHQLWDAGAGWHAGRICARLQMRLAGLGENSPFREAVVHEITERLWEEGKDPFTQRGVVGPRVGPAPRPDIRVPIRIALRESTCTMAGTREAAQPTNLAIAQEADEAVKQALRRGFGDTLEALPMFQEDRRTVAHNRAVSERREALQSWVASEEGAAWRATRSAIFDASIAEPAAALGEAALADDLEEVLALE